MAGALTPVTPARLAARALGRRHWILQAILVPTAHRMMGYRTLHYELIPG